MPIHARLFPLVGNAWQTWKPVWQKILEDAGSSSPFLEWDWLSLWWQHFGARESESAHLCVAFDNDSPIGALPVVVGPARRGRILNLRSVQVMGNRLYDSRNIFSEYLDIAASPAREAAARAVITGVIHKHFQPDEFVIGWTSQVSPWVRALGEVPASHVRIASRERTYQADLSRGFGAYAASLGGSTRRSVVNLRARLECRGPVHVGTPGSTEQALLALDELNRLHALRWGKPAFSGSALNFHRDLIRAWLPSGRIAITQLLSGERCISVCYDLRLGPTQYNIQLGFDAAFEPKASPGLIHLGHAMEMAAAQGVRTYDFLAGKGRTSDYKQHLASTSHEVCTVQMLRGPFLSRLYRMVDRLRHRNGGDPDSWLSRDPSSG